MKSECYPSIKKMNSNAAYWGRLIHSQLSLLGHCRLTVKCNLNSDLKKRIYMNTEGMIIIIFIFYIAPQQQLYELILLYNSTT